MITTTLYKCSQAILFGLLASTCVHAQERLLLVDRDNLMTTAPTETLLGQNIWDMHTTELSRTSLIELREAAPQVSHAEGERTLIVLEGQLEFLSAGERQTLGAGDYVAIPANRPYQIEPSGNSTPLILGFDVPIIDMRNASTSLPDDKQGALPTIRKQATIMASPTSWDDPSDRGWTLAKTAQKRVNLVEMRSELQNHSHPDADHSLILLSGSARVVTPAQEQLLKPGDYVSIPQNVAHKYYVEGDQPALFISFDAPAYDPAKTIFFD